MRSDLCTRCGGVFRNDRDGLWKGDTREHFDSNECLLEVQRNVRELHQQIESMKLAWAADAQAAADAMRERDEARQQLAEARAENETLRNRIARLAVKRGGK
jgi:hypothetical protein